MFQITMFHSFLVVLVAFAEVHAATPDFVARVRDEESRERMLQSIEENNFEEFAAALEAATADHPEFRNIYDDFERATEMYNEYEGHSLQIGSVGELAARLEAFFQNRLQIDYWNNEEGSEATFGINMFSAMFPSELNFGFVEENLKENFLKTKPTEVKLKVDPPKSVDWRSQNTVGRVKNQGSCGSCWAFSVVATTENHFARKSGKLVHFSEKQVLDCNGRYTCRGGIMAPVAKQIAQPTSKLHPLQLESDYPYKPIL